jgi:hypothetical protein
MVVKANSIVSYPRAILWRMDIRELQNIAFSAPDQNGQGLKNPHRSFAIDPSQLVPRRFGPNNALARTHPPAILEPVETARLFEVVEAQPVFGKHFFVRNWLVVPEPLAGSRDLHLLFSAVRFIVVRRTGKRHRQRIGNPRNQAASDQNLLIRERIQKKLNLLALFRDIGFHRFPLFGRKPPKNQAR